MMTSKEYHDALRELVFSLLSKNEKQIVDALDGSEHPLSLPELNKQVDFTYRTLKRIVKRLETKKILVGFRDVIKIVSLNSVLYDEYDEGVK
jgi:predicted transcriptional regulator